MKKKVQKTQTNPIINRILLIGGNILLTIADVLIATIYLIFAIASSLNLSSFFKPFVYISFILSLVVLLMSTINKLKNNAQKYKSLALTLSIFFAFLYASIRMKVFPNFFQFEDLGTAIVIITSYLIILFEKRKKITKSKENEHMELESVSRETYGEEYDSAVLEQWKTCVEMANSNTEKRSNSNNIFITINAALLAVVSFSLDSKSLLLSIVGIAVCVVWLCSIENYKKLSSVKYYIVNEIELKLPLKPFSYEWEKLKNETNYLGLTKIEKILPWLFIVLYGISILLPIINWLPTIICTCHGG